MCCSNMSCSSRVVHHHLGQSLTHFYSLSTDSYFHSFLIFLDCAMCFATTIATTTPVRMSPNITKSKSAGMESKFFAGFIVLKNKSNPPYAKNSDVLSMGDPTDIPFVTRLNVVASEIVHRLLNGIFFLYGNNCSSLLAGVVSYVMGRRVFTNLASI